MERGRGPIIKQPVAVSIHDTAPLAAAVHSLVITGLISVTSGLDRPLLYKCFVSTLCQCVDFTMYKNDTTGVFIESNYALNNDVSTITLLFCSFLVLFNAIKTMSNEAVTI